MVRSMYSGVSGLRTHQTRMDTIGNNIANVNTYGFKSGRTTFRDIYYQNISSASGPTAAQGGMNASQVGYGSKVGGVDLMMGRSTFTMTDQTMDLAVDGDGFFQVMDNSGNIYYTRAGMLNFDAAGNLVDMQGNFVLGVNGDPTGRAPASEKIRVNLPNVNPAAGSVTQTINGKEFTIKASNNTVDSNISFNFSSDATITDGVKAVAQVSTTGIIVTFNANEHFSSWADVNAAVNDAIFKANGGKDHVAGTFDISCNNANDPFSAANLPAGRTYLTGAELASTDYGVQYGKFPISGNIYGITATGKVGSTFSGNGAISGATVVHDNTATPETLTVEVTINGKVYRGVIDATRSDPGTFNLVNTAAGADANDYITLNRPKFSDIISQATTAGPPATFTAKTAADLGTAMATPSAPSFALGLSSTALALTGGTAGGAQTLADMTGIAVAPNGIIYGYDSQGTEVVVGRIDLATFANAAGLNLAGSSNYTVSANSGAPKLTQPGTDGSGKLVGGSLELSNVDLSREFSDMITTQRGYQANSRIITVSDTMLEELINLKR